jgi:imidazolonepropionase-like amidohydrolase
VVRKTSVRTACPWRITNSTLYEAGNLQATIEAGFTTVQSLGAAIDKDVRDAINAGAIPGPRLLTSIHQITEKSGAPAKLREMVRQTKAEGGDVIKIFATEHGTFLDDATLQLMHDRGIFFDPNYLVSDLSPQVSFWEVDLFLCDP